MRKISVDSLTRCAVYDINPSGSRTILFVHGWPFNHKIFEHQTAILPNYGIRCISYDIRGFGESDKPWSGYSYDKLATDLYRIIQSINAKQITLCGFSMGGAICVRYMQKYCGYKVSRLILMGAACPCFVQRPGYTAGVTQQQTDALLSQAYHDRPLMCDTFTHMCFAQNQSEPYLQQYKDYGLNAASHSTIKCLETLKNEDLRGDLGQIKIPTAIFHGKHDRICPYAMAEELHRGIPNSFVVPFEQSGHCLFSDEKDRCNSEIISFI